MLKSLLGRKAPAQQDMSDTICVIGNSHTLALMSAVKQDAIAGFHIINRRRSPEIFAKADGKTAIKAQNFDPNRLGIKAPKFLGLSMGGNQYNILAMLRHPQPFTLAGIPAEDPGARVVTSGMMRTILAQKSTEYFTLAERIRAHFSSTPAALICPPPPVEQASHIEAYPAAFADQMHLGVAPAALRKGVYDVQVGLYRDLANDLNLHFVEPPVEAVTPQGFLHINFAQKDPTHANARYGRLVLDQLTTLEAAAHG